MKKAITIIIAGLLVICNSSVVFAQETDKAEVIATTNQQTYNDIELNDYGTGAILDEDELDETIFNVNHDNNLILLNRNLESSCDLSAEPFFPNIKSQGWVGSCCSWATTYYQYGYQVAKMKNWTQAKTSPSYQFTPKYVYNLINGGQNHGSSFSDNYKILKTRGAPAYYYFAPSPNTNNTPQEYREWCTNIEAQKNANKYKVIDCTPHYINQDNVFNLCPIVSTNSHAIVIIKSLLSTHHVLTFSTNYGGYISNSPTPVYPNGISNKNWIYDTVSNPSSNDKVCIMCQNNTQSGESGAFHALSIVGYDDNIWYDYNHDGLQSPSEMGALKIANSHGTEYGNNGFMWVMYDALNVQSSNTGIEYNSSNRQSIISQLRYFSIEIANSGNDLLALVTITQNDRSENKLRIKTVNDSDWTEFELNKAGSFRYDGTDISQPQTAKSQCLELRFSQLSWDIECYRRGTW